MRILEITVAITKPTCCMVENALFKRELVVGFHALDYIL